MECLTFTLPNDDRIKGFFEILEKYDSDYQRLHLHSIVAPHRRIKFVIFMNNDKMINELTEFSKTKYDKWEGIRQLKFELTPEQFKVLVDISLK